MPSCPRGGRSTLTTMSSGSWANPVSAGNRVRMENDHGFRACGSLFCDGLCILLCCLLWWSLDLMTVVHVETLWMKLHFFFNQEQSCLMSQISHIRGFKKIRLHSRNFILLIYFFVLLLKRNMGIHFKAYKQLRSWHFSFVVQDCMANLLSISLFCLHLHRSMYRCMAQRPGSGSGP